MKSNEKTLGDWCKFLEKNFSLDIAIPTLPLIIRLDGNNFSNWTKGLKRPFDLDFCKLMVETTKFLVKETNAVVGYTQSDEITLILYSPSRKSSIYHEGKKQKIVSKLTSKCTNFFNTKRLKLLPGFKLNTPAVFDCRVYQTPTLNDATTQLLWRELDATRNSVQSLAHFNFSEAQCYKKNTDQLQELLWSEKGINWGKLPANLKRGTYIKRRVTSESFSPEELSNLPAKHAARNNPDLVFERSIITEIEYPIFSKILNRESVIFEDALPQVADELT